MKHFLLILLVVNGFCFESEIHYGGNIIKLPKCNINMVVDSSLVYIGDLTTDYYDDDNSKILIGKVVYRLNGVGMIYKFTLPSDMPQNTKILSRIGFDYYLKWTLDKRTMKMMYDKNVITFMDSTFLERNCIG